MRSVLSLFGRSPFRLVQEQMSVVMECVRQLRPLYEAIAAEDAESVARVVDEIDRLEAEADRAKNAIRDHLPKAVFLPVDRRDLLELVHMIDGMADSVQEAAGVLALRPMRVPAELREAVFQFVDDVLSACERGATIIDHLAELVETGFGGPDAERVLSMIEQLDAAETKSELLGRDIVRRLFALDAGLSDIEVMLWREVLEHTSGIANNAERAGNRLRLLIAKP